MTTGVGARLAAVRARIRAAAERAGRDAGAVRLVAVSKLQPVEAIVEAMRAGQTVFGESYVQEAAAKQQALAAHADAGVRALAGTAEWHLVGPLQRNKAREAARRFALVHSVDRQPLVEALARHAGAQGRRVGVLVQVNVSGEATKAGVDPAGAAALVGAVLAAPALDLRGLMAIPAPAPTAEAARPAFAALRRLRDRLVAEGVPAARLVELSMGMSDDFEVAVEEGATLVRVGTALFGPRTGPSAWHGQAG